MKNKAGWDNRVTGELFNLGSPGLWDNIQFKHFKWSSLPEEKKSEHHQVKRISRTSMFQPADTQVQ